MSIFLERSINGGSQVIHKFENGYGASVVQHEFSYGGDEGLYELAVLAFNGDNWDLTYDTEITDDVIGYLSDEDVQDLLKQIENLEKQNEQ